MSQLLYDLRTALAPRYRVEREIGRGGMATVFLADDAQMGRQVAVKVLHPELSSSLGADRFAREIQVLARLSHPNVLPVLDSGDADGLLYYVMPFVAGESLADRLRREGQLAIEEAVGVACEVADALAFAHEAGIVHRDVKPENVLLSGGKAIVADFGIARLLNDDAANKLTMTGTSLGTAAYMSPEQAAGEKADPRSDLYSLACLLYELLVGAPPFTGPNAMAVMARHAMEPPPSIRVVRAAVPEEVEAVILKALEKAPADRFKSVTEFKQALLGESGTSYTSLYTARYTAMRPAARAPWWRQRAAMATAATVLLAASGVGTWWSVRPAGASTRDPDASRVAVLYFDDTTPDDRLRHVADALTEALIEQLRAVQALEVVSENGVRPYRGTDVAPDSLRRAFGVGSVVRGSVSEAPGGVRVSFALVDALSGTAIDTKSIVVPRARLANVDETVAQEVADFLRGRVGQRMTLTHRRRTAPNTEAWLLVQQADKQRKDADSAFAGGASAPALRALDDADARLARASALATAWAEPQTLRAVVAYRRTLVLRGTDRTGALGAAAAGLVHADSAISLDERSADAHAARGQLRWMQVVLQPDAPDREADRLLADAEASLVRAVDIDPRHAVAWATLSALHYRRYDLRAALNAAREAYDADAYLANARTVLMRLFEVSHDLKDHAQATEWCVKGAERFPVDRFFVQCRLYLGWMPAREGERADSVWRHARRYVELSPPGERPIAERVSRILAAGVLARSGLRDSARAVLRTTRADATLDPHRQTVGMEAPVRVILGDHDEAVALIEDYLVANPSHRRGFVMRMGWWWEAVQSHPKFVRLLAGAR